MNKPKFNEVYKLNIISLILFLTCISECKLFTGEVKARESEGKSNIFSMNHTQLVQHGLNKATIKNG